MLIIRLRRTGRRNDPTFRVVVTDSKNAPQSGKFLEILGTHIPTRKETNLKTERIQYWLSVGAKTSATVHNLLIKQGIIIGKKIKVSPQAVDKKEEEGQTEVKSEASEGSPEEEKAQPEPPSEALEKKAEAEPAK